MNFLKAAAAMAMLVGTVAIGCKSAQATPLAAAANANKEIGAQFEGNSAPFLLPAQYRRDGRRPGPGRYPPRARRDRGGGDSGAAVAAGIFGLILGGIIAAEAQRQQAIAYCAQRYRSYDPNTMTYLGYDGQRHPCP